MDGILTLAKKLEIKISKTGVWHVKPSKRENMEHDETWKEARKALRYLKKARWWILNSPWSGDKDALDAVKQIDDASLWLTRKLWETEKQRRESLKKKERKKWVIMK